MDHDALITLAAPYRAQSTGWCTTIMARTAVSVQVGSRAGHDPDDGVVGRASGARRALSSWLRVASRDENGREGVRGDEPDAGDEQRGAWGEQGAVGSDTEHRFAELTGEVSLIAVRAGAARMVIDEQPDEARAALSIIETTSRRALREMRRLVGVLRQPNETGHAELEPAPGLALLASSSVSLPKPVYTSMSTSLATSEPSPTASTSRRTASSRKHSPTSCATPAPPTRTSGFVTDRTKWRSS